MDESLLYFCGLVYQSYPSPSKEPYPVYACVGSTGNIFSAACKCVAGLGESCSHVAALLFLVEAASKSRQARLPDDVTCTDKTMSWYRPPKNYAEKLTKAVQVSEIVLQKATYGKLPMKVAGAGTAPFEPRSDVDQDLNPVGLTKLLDAVSVSCPTQWIASLSRAPVLAHDNASSASTGRASQEAGGTSHSKPMLLAGWDGSDE